MTDGLRLRSPGVRFPPPLLFVAGFALGWFLEWLGPALPVVMRNVVGIRTLGTVVLVAGIALIAWGAITFGAAGTTLLPYRGASAMVTTGPYRFTRNPMYLGMTLFYSGAAFLLNSLWPLFFLPAVLFLLVHLVIRREEAYLRQAFPQEYHVYRIRVRRWL